MRVTVRLAELKRRTPGWLRSGLRALAYTLSMPLRSRGLLPGEILSHGELDVLADDQSAMVHQTERVEHTWPDPTAASSPVQSPPRPVDTTYSIIRCEGASGWRFDNNHLVDPDGRIAYETNLRTTDLGAAFQTFERTPKQVDGVVAYLSNTWPTNFFHWMVLTVPMLERYRRFPEGPPDWYYIGEAPRPWQLESLEMAGISADQLLFEAVTADELWSVSQTRHGGGLDPAALNFVRSLASSETLQPGTRRLFIERGPATTRRFLNEDETYEAVAGLGFERVSTSGLSLKQEVELFSEAAVVLSCHGSALTNLLFVPPGTTLVELLPFGLHEPSNHLFQEMIAAARGSYLALEGLEPGGTNRKPIDRDLLVDAEHLRRLLEAAL